MNKYQTKALEFLGVNPSEFGKTISAKTSSATKGLRIENDSILVFADRDIYSKDYTLQFLVGRYIKVELRFGNKWVPQETTEYEFDVRQNNCVSKQRFIGVESKINLDNRPDKLKLIIPGKVCDDIIIDIKYDIMTEEEYWKVQNSPETLRKKMEVSFRTADDLVNIYWKHAKENIIALVRIDLYMKNGESRQLMGKYKETDEIFFKSIGGLAYGKYCFQLFQFDKDNKEIASTDFIDFELKKPESDNGGSGGFGRNRHTVVIG